MKKKINEICMNYLLICMTFATSGVFSFNLISFCFCSVLFKNVLCNLLIFFRGKNYTDDVKNKNSRIKCDPLGIKGLSCCIRTSRFHILP